MERGELKVIEAEPAVVDGQQRWLNTIKAPLKDAAGNVTGIVGFVHDITELQNIQTILSQRATELETVANVGTVAATILEPDELLQQVVDLTKERFNLYHAHIYLLNQAKAELALTTGAGSVGQTMVAEGRRIALSQEQSLVARAARSHEGVVINDVQAEPGFLPHPLLPETRSEMAVPLMMGNEVQGVLDVQADSVNRFTAEDISIFTTLATQVAVALQNARRYDETQRALDELTRLQRIMAREGWEAFLTGQERPFVGYTFDGKGSKLMTGEEPKLAPVEKTNGKKKKKGKGKASATAIAPPDSAVSIPIAIHGETIGQLGLRNPDGSAIPERKQVLLKAIALQVSEALERARLSEQTQQALAETNEQARRLAVLNELSETISRKETLQEIVSVLMEKVPDILKASRISLHLIDDADETMLRVAGVSGSVADVPAEELIPLAESPMAQALKTRQIVSGAFDTGEEMLQAYFAPLYASGRPLGTFNMVIPVDATLAEGIGKFCCRLPLC